MPATGWSVAAVPALISFDHFFALLADRRFPRRHLHSPPGRARLPARARHLPRDLRPLRHADQPGLCPLHPPVWPAPDSMPARRSGLSGAALLVHGGVWSPAGGGGLRIYGGGISPPSARPPMPSRASLSCNPSICWRSCVPLSHRHHAADYFVLPRLDTLYGLEGRGSWRPWPRPVVLACVHPAPPCRQAGELTRIHSHDVS
jgi:phenylalanine-4-hydroxylase